MMPIAPDGYLREDLRRVLRAACGPPEERIQAFRTFADAFDLHAEVEPDVFAVLPLLDANVVRSAPADAFRCAHATTAARVRGIARRAWTANQVQVPPLTRLLNVLEHTGVDALLLPGGLTARALFGMAAVELGTTKLVVSPEDLLRAASVLVAAGATGDQELRVAVARPGHLSAFDARLEGATIRLESWHRALARAGDAHARTPIVLGTLRASTLCPPLRIWFDLDAIVNARHPGDRGQALVDLLAVVSDRGGGLEEGECAGVLASVVCDGEAADSVASLLHELAECLDGVTGASLTNLANVVEQEARRRVTATEAQHRHADSLRRSVEAVHDSPAPSDRPNPAIRALRLLGAYRRYTRANDQLVSARGLSRFIARRWRVRPSALPRATLGKLRR